MDRPTPIARAKQWLAGRQPAGPQDDRPRETGDPAIRPIALAQHRDLLFAAKLVVEGRYAGRHRSPYHDISAEFSDYRPYVAGDDPRTVDWKAVARTDRLYVRQFRKETDMSAYLVVDASASMGYAGPDGTTKLRYAAILAASIAYLMIRQSDRPGLTVCADTIRRHHAPNAAMRHLYALTNTLEQARAEGQTDLPRALRSLFPMARQRGLLIVLSDLLDAPEPLFEALGMYLHRGFAVLLLQILTDDELALPGVGPVRFIDPEGGAVREADVEAVRPSYAAGIQAHLRALSEGARARRVGYALLSTSSPCERALDRYLSMRFS